MRSGRGCISEGCEGLGSEGGTFAQKSTIDIKRVQLWVDNTIKT